jgi:cytidylate kinase
MTPRTPIVTIDGPSGSGKGTISRAVAIRLGWHFLDSGTLYRLRFEVTPDGGELVLLEGEVVTDEIRSEVAGQGASRVAAWPGVRSALLDRQRAFARPPGLVADGRDMGTIVFPGADLKIFLTATPDERALRRYKQLKDKGSDVSLAALSREITERDLRDSTRTVAPLKPAPDAEVIDSTGLTIEQVVDRVMAAGRMRALWA